MRASVIISRVPWNPSNFEITVTKSDGKVLSGLRGGSDAGEVAGMAAMYAAEHCLRSKEGGDIVGPAMILNLIPPHLRSISHENERKL